MTTETTENKDTKDEILEKTKDFWAKHNIGTRTMLIIFAVSFLAVVIAGLYGVAVPVAIIDMVWYSAIIGFATVTLGVNGVNTLMEGVAKLKGK